MTHQPHNAFDLPQTTLPRRRVFQSLTQVGATLALASLIGCGGGSNDEDDEAGNEEEEEETGGDQEADD